MSDPIRWLDEGADVLAHERELLSAGRNIIPPAGADEKIWAALSPHLGPGGGSGGNGGSSSANTATNGSTASGSSGSSISVAVGGVKGVALGIATVTAIAGVVAALVTTSPTRPITNPVHTQPIVEMVSPPQIDASAANESLIEGPAPDTIISPPTSPTLPTLPPRPPDTQQGQTLPRRVSSAKPVTSVAAAPVADVNRIDQERASQLREESRILGDARAALRSGDAATALEKLDAMGGRFPGGVLAQEREVLAIEALARAGQRAAATARAEAFLQAYPTSPHATKVRGFLK
jgi:hypothetical protein